MEPKKNLKLGKKKLKKKKRKRNSIGSILSVLKDESAILAIVPPHFCYYYYHYYYYHYLYDPTSTQANYILKVQHKVLLRILLVCCSPRRLDSCWYILITQLPLSLSLSLSLRIWSVE